MVALVYNRWTLFVRLVQPDKPIEAISSRSFLLYGVATPTHHAGQTRLTLTSLHAKQSAIQARLTSLAGVPQTLKATMEQWTNADRLQVILAWAFAEFLRPTAGPPPLLISEPPPICHVDCRFQYEGSTLFGNHLLSSGSVLLMLSVLVGYYLWWASRGNWRSAFTIKRGAQRTRLHYALHKVVGACAGGLLLVSLFTAISLYEPWTQAIVSGVNLLLPVTGLDAPPPASMSIEGQKPITVGRVIEIIKTTLPSGRPVSLEFPVDEQGTYMVTVDTGAVWKSQVSIDQYNGAVVRVQGPQAASVGDHVLGWLFPLHTGQAFGLPGRIVLVILGVSPTCLYVTGFFLWWRKRRISRVEGRL